MWTSRRIGLMAGAAAAVACAGCGGSSDFANRPRPPAPISVSAAVTPRGLSVSPHRFGAGPIRLLIANLTQRSVDVRLDDVGGTQASSRSGPINPQGTGTIATDVEPGTYRLIAGSRSATLTVGRQRPSAQNDLNLP